MSMILKCESEFDLSDYREAYGIIKCGGVSDEMASYFDGSRLWTVYADFFDEMVTDAYAIWSSDKNRCDVLLMDLLEELIPLCSQIAMFWVDFDKDSMICFNDESEYKEGLKHIILSDYKCMFHCWYRNPKYFP